MTKRTMFSKILSLNILSIFICILVMGSTQMILFTNYLSSQSEDYLSKNAEFIVNMITRNVNRDALTDMANGFSMVTGSYIFVIDARGRVLSCSDDSELLDTPPPFLEDKYTKEVLTGKKTTTIGTMGDLFSETMFTLQVPISDKQNNILGAVLVSRPIPEHQRMRYEMFRILLMSMFLITAIAFLPSYFLAKRFSYSMKNITCTTREFAKGNFAARVAPYTERSEILEISELAEAFNSMAADLEKAEEIKNAFVSDVSHELRTPMTTIGGFVSGILDGTIPADRQEEYLTIVRDEISRLSRLVNTFLDITRLQSDKTIINMTNFDITELIRIAIIGLEQKIEAKNINVELSLEEENCYAYADRDSITRVITNLIDNAVKFTNPDGNITISVTTRQRDIFISVRNTGNGIPKEQLGMIFQRFYKTDKSRSENREGTGIGLYLVKNILNAHGRDITVDSREGEYTEFVFSLAKGKSPHTRGKKSEDTPDSNI
ncbi:MAG: HAMP domain-containing sensor histidine kinase [Clostridia bacterium]|nr:HAMP domain-containing sensor histidine kinase [Clostridia bacterium]